MQKVINILSILSFIGVVGIIGGGAYVYIQRDVLIEDAKEKVAEAATEAVAGALPGLIDAAMPEIPQVTGSAIPVGEDKGGSISGMRLP